MTNTIIVNLNKIKKNSIWYDSLILLILFIVGYIIKSIFKINFNFSFDYAGGILIGLFGTLLGFVITSFTILFMFDTGKNTTLKKIKDAGLFNQIYERFVTTIIVTFISLAYSIGYLFIMEFYSGFILNFILVYLSFLVLLRTYRSLNILYLIYQTI